uniref:mRNA m(6)A methyltransferase n=1 Tax=Blastobotrys adeninivorans TaxID=409370 RepID=A0A060T8V8_BLAAD
MVLSGQRAYRRSLPNEGNLPSTGREIGQRFNDDTCIMNSILEYLIAKETQIFSQLPLKVRQLIECYAIDNWETFDGCSYAELIEALQLTARYIPNGLVLQDDYLVFFEATIIQKWLDASAAGGLAIGEPVMIPDPVVEGDIVAEIKQSDLAGELSNLLCNSDSFSSKQQQELESLVDGSTGVQELFKQRALQKPPRPYTEICSNKSRNDCLIKGNLDCLNKIHFETVITSTTDVSIGDCSYLDTCYKGKGCKYVHYKIVYPETLNKTEQHQTPPPSFFNAGERMCKHFTMPAQWISCDIRKLDLEVLGDFAAIIADRKFNKFNCNRLGSLTLSSLGYPYECMTQKSSYLSNFHVLTQGHLQLPYGVITDEEILSFQIDKIQTEGVFFLWVTGRALDIGRQCLKKWGYSHIEEIIWCKTNQLGRTICTGRTGHWLNHSKEHVLMGIKGCPPWLAQSIDVDTIVSVTRDKSHKPDELYGIVDRLVGQHARKLELFGREHNLRDGWLTVGNQLQGNRILETQVRQRFEAWKSQ